MAMMPTRASLSCMTLSGDSDSSQTLSLRIIVAPEIECTVRHHRSNRIFTCIACLPEHRLVLFDDANQELLLFDTIKSSFGSLCLNSSCWALTNAGDNNISATVDNKVMFFNIVKEKLVQMGRKLTFPGKTKGISFSNGYFAVVIESNNCNTIQVLKAYGSAVRQTLDLKYGGESLIIPDHVLLDGEHIYFCHNDSVVCVSKVSGVTLWVEKHMGYKYIYNPLPLGGGLAILDSTDCLSLLDMEGKCLSLQQLSSKSQELPICLAYDDPSRTLYVVYNKSAVVKVYNIICLEEKRL